jgi:UDP-N-acetyl-D-mannosaminuronic acid transferase (WecB/TagA/CpsF family)
MRNVVPEFATYWYVLRVPLQTHRWARAVLILPDGQSMVFLTYGADVKGHPENKEVMLRLMSLADKKNHRVGETLRRAGNHQCTVVVSGQQATVSYMLIPSQAGR